MMGVTNKFALQFELAWKLLKETLAYEGVAAAASGSPREILKAGFATYDFIDGDLWLEMLKTRNDLPRISTMGTPPAPWSNALSAYIPESQTGFSNAGEGGSAGVARSCAPSLFSSSCKMRHFTKPIFNKMQQFKMSIINKIRSERPSGGAALSSPFNNVFGVEVGEGAAQAHGFEVGPTTHTVTSASTSGVAPSPARPTAECRRAFCVRSPAIPSGPSRTSSAR